MHPARTHPLASMWPALQRANLCLEAPPRPPLVRAPLALGWAHQAAASPLGRPQHPSRALLEKDLPFPLVRDPSPQGLGNSYRPGGSTLARSSPWPLPPLPLPFTPPANNWTLAPARKSLSPSSSMKLRSLNQSCFSHGAGRRSGRCRGCSLSCRKQKAQALGGWEGRKGGRAEACDLT